MTRGRAVPVSRILIHLQEKAGQLRKREVTKRKMGLVEAEKRAPPGGNQKRGTSEKYGAIFKCQVRNKQPGSSAHYEK